MSKIQHTVAFLLNDDADSDMFFGRAAALGNLAGVENFEVLEQIGKKSQFKSALSMWFEDEASYAAYNDHPEHQDFVHNVWIPNVADFMELDYLRA